LIEVDAASRAKVDETRELMDNVVFAPTRGRFKVYLIDEVHMFSEKSFNALLKTLEEPPPHVKFVLATTDPQKLPVTVLSRCLQFNLRQMPRERIVAHLEWIIEQEGVDVEAGALRLLARAARGSMRDALSLLDQAIAFGAGKVALGEVREMLGTLDEAHVAALLEGLATGDAAALLARSAEMAAQTVDFDEALAELLTALQRIAARQLVPEIDAGDDEDELPLGALAERVEPEDVQLWYQIALHGRRDLTFSPEPRGGFEMTLLRMLAFRPAEAGAAPAPGGGDAGVGTRSTAPPSATAPGERRGAPVATPPPTGKRPPVEEQAPAARPVRALSAANWHEVIDALELSGLSRELACHCELVAVNGGKLHLRLAAERAPLAAGRVKEKLAQALGRFLGQDIRLEVEVGALSSETPAQRNQRSAEARHAEAVRAVQADPGVHAICEMFDATVDESRVRVME